MSWDAEADRDLELFKPNNVASMRNAFFCFSFFRRKGGKPVAYLESLILPPCSIVEDLHVM